VRALPSTLAGVAAGIAVAAGVLAAVNLSGSADSSAGALARNPELDPGSTLADRPAPSFTLADGSGRSVSLRAYRGKVVMLAFTDPECTTICPLTTAAMLEARRMLGRAASRVALLGIDANPQATSRAAVREYTRAHGLDGHWRFLTGSRARLTRVWRAYGVAVAIEHGQVDHTPALFVIDPQGRLRRLYLTQQSYAAVPQLAQLLAREASALLSPHPRVHAHLSYAAIPSVAPTATARLPTTAGGTVGLGPGRARLLLFFATWDQGVTGLARPLEALNGYQAAAGRAGLPRLTAVDEASVDPGGALHGFLRRLRRPLTYPVAIDSSGRVADGYGVQGQPWFALTSPAGRIAWYWNVSTQGWPSRSRLIAAVRAALRSGAGAAPSGADAGRLSGSPAPLAALHAQADRLLGSGTALAARIHALRGYPIVVNAWASWCSPCAQEFSLFADASVRYGRQVAFLGADVDDSPGNATAFLDHHPVSYPSYQTTTSGLQWLVPGNLEGLPTTIYIDRAGKVASIHTGQYASQGTLDADIQAVEQGG
jgi:cytochrome c biogenesis protein CcmG/thiol:disulfide interchange protein DsbE